MSKRAVSIVGILLSTALASSGTMVLAGCPAGPTYIVQQYQGPQRDHAAIGILRVNGKDGLPLETLDNQEITARVAEDARLHVEILPGRHTVSVRGSVPAKRISFEAEGGRVYRVVMDGAAPHVHEVDPDNDSIGRDVTASTE